ncbi:unnamed protein product [Rhizophagus irregularis]|nr:unnamed protein product [Rhizophagus irregularis]
MSQDDWLEFSQHTKRLCEFRRLFEDEIDDVHDLNRLWDDTQHDWFCIKAKLFEIAGTYESEINLDGFLTNINLAANRKQIKTLCRSLMALFSIKMQEYNEEQMKNFIHKRCEDFTDNKKAMINSIAEREIRTIVLVRIVHETPTGTTLVTDPVEIKKLTNDHF